MVFLKCNNNNNNYYYYNSGTSKGSVKTTLPLWLNMG